MPIYEYQCRACGHHLEELQKVSDPVLVTCPECGKDTLEKQVSHTSFQLKGTGWYATDFKDSGKKPAKTDVPTTETKTESDSAAAKPTSTESSKKSED